MSTTSSGPETPEDATRHLGASIRPARAPGHLNGMRTGASGSGFEKMRKTCRIGDLDLALAHEQQPTGLELRKGATDRL